MKKVRFLDEPKEEKALKPIEFTHFLSASDGWIKTSDKPNSKSTIVYLGNCVVDGDMFFENYNGAFLIYKGNLNDGIY